MAEGGTTLEYTPTWVVALVCTVIVLISLTVERIIHYTGKACHTLSLSLSAFYHFSIVIICHTHMIFYPLALQYLKKNNQKPLFEALQKIKEGPLTLPASLCFFFNFTNRYIHPHDDGYHI